ncbi:MAG TPA: alpha/beta fold hydrolase [Thermoanaerobaculia bacterium]
MRRLAIASVFALAGCASQSNLHLAPCRIADAPARCGTFDVPESPQSSRRLALKVIVLPATERNESAIFPFVGGPGVPATPGAGLEVTEFAAERRLHDAVFVDERGSGGSAPLVCPSAMKTHDHELIEQDLFPTAFVADCRREIEAYADPSQYTFDRFVDDVDTLRQALGYGPINIVAMSAGTRAALTLLARHPQSVRTMLLTGPVPPQNRIPLNFAADSQPVLDSILGNHRDLDAALALLPVDIQSGEYTIHMTRGAFMEYLRTRLYTAESRSSVPTIVKSAASGDWQSIAPDFIKYRRNFYDGVGVFLSITCPTDVRYIRDEEATDYRVARQVAACKQWTPGLAPRVSVTTTSVPVLIFSGGLDPVTPMRWATMLAHDLGHARVIGFSNDGHTESGPCADKIEVEFFDAGSFGKINDYCASITP